jgi:hypothetical protein
MKRRGKDNNYILLFFMFLLFCLLVLFMANSKTIQEGFENMMGQSSGEKPFTFEYYYTETCPYCVKFNESGVWDQLSAQKYHKVQLKKRMVYDKDHKPVKENVDKASTFNINSFPSFVMVRNGTNQVIMTYDGDRSFADMNKFVMRYE